MSEPIDIAGQASKAAKVVSDGQVLERRSVDELIKAEKFRQQQEAVAGDGFGPLFQTFQPPGTV